MKGRAQTLSFQELQDHPKFRTAYNGYCTLDGVACTQIGNDREVFLDSKGKTTDFIQPSKHDGRTLANQQRTGLSLERNGKFVRSSEVRRTIIAWVAAIGGIHKVRFFTVTFPCGTSDLVGRKILNILMTRWRKLLPDLTYLWTAERQENGTIHYHLVTNRFTSISLLNSYVRASLGTYITEIPNYEKSDLPKYNGVHVGKECYHELGIVKYLAKYLTKAKKTGINQPWHRSRAMGCLATKVRFSMDRVRAIIKVAEAEVANSDASFRVFENDFCLFISWPPSISRLIEYHLDKYNKARWRGSTQQSKYNFHARPAEELKERLLLQTPSVTGLQLNILDSFPAINYQARGRKPQSFTRITQHRDVSCA